MNLTSYTTEVTSRISDISPLSIPHILWMYYLEYLWFYEPDSWVAKISNACLIIAILVSLPIIILGLLDIASYGIARTLGVIDDVKASTSDKATIHTKRDAPSILITGVNSPSSESTFSDSDRDSGMEHTTIKRRQQPLSAPEDLTPLTPFASQPSLFYVGEENSLKLSGVDVFSPAASQPPSPTISRHNLASLNESNGDQLRRRTQQREE